MARIKYSSSNAVIQDFITGDAKEIRFPEWFDECSSLYLESHDGFGGKKINNTVFQKETQAQMDRRSWHPDDRVLADQLAGQFFDWVKDTHLADFSHCPNPESEVNNFCSAVRFSVSSRIKYLLDTMEPKRSKYEIFAIVYIVISFILYALCPLTH